MRIHEGATILTLDQDLPKRPTFVADGTGAGTDAHLCTTYDIAFQPKDIGSVAIVSSSARTASGDVDELSKFGGGSKDPNANTIIEDTERNSLLFPIPNQPLKRVTSYDYTFITKFHGTVSSGVLQVPADPEVGGTATFPVSGLLSSSQADENFTVVISNNGSDGTVSNGQYLSFSNTDGVSRTISVSGATATITPAVSDGVVLDIIYTGKKTVTTSKTKTIVAGNTTVANTGNIEAQIDEGQFRINTPNTAVGSSERLPVADVFNIVKIIDSGDPTVDVTNNMISTTANNIINSYTLETGQTDNFYDHSSIKLKPGAPTCLLYTSPSPRD